MASVEVLARYLERILSQGYLLPTNRIATFLVALIVALGVGWVGSLLLQTGRLRSARRTIEDLVGMTDLLASIQARDREDARTRFEEALLAGNMDSAHPVTRHVEAIFLAGVVEARLDIGELLRRTEGRLIAGDVARRYVLSLFIIIGLFGTLFGLADALVGLSSAAGVQKNFALVLSGLRSAFAPSIWGVGVSIVCTFLFAWYQSGCAAPTVDELRTTTLHTWIPRLYPTTAQRFTETMQRGLEAAKEVAEFAADVRHDTGQLREAVHSSVRATDLFQDRVDSLRTLFETAEQSFQARVSELLSHTAECLRALERWTAAEADIRRTQDALAAHQERHGGLLQETQNAIVELGRAFTEMRRATAEEVAAAREAHAAMVRGTTTVLEDWRQSTADHIGSATAAHEAMVERVAGGVEGWRQSTADQVTNATAAHEVMIRHVTTAIEGWRRSTAEQIAGATTTNEALLQRVAEVMESWRESTVAHVDAQTQEVTRRLETFEAAVRSLRVPFESAADKMTRAALGFQHLVENALRSRPPAAPPQTGGGGDRTDEGAQRIERTLVAILRELERRGGDQHSGLRQRFRRWLET